MSGANEPVENGLKKLFIDRTAITALADSPSRDDSPACAPDLNPFVGPESFNPAINFQETMGSTYSWSPANNIMANGCQRCYKIPAKSCAGCGAVRYCGTECQRIMWNKEHKENCGKTYAVRLENILRHGQPVWYPSIYQFFGFSKATTGGDLERLRQVYLELLDAPKLGFTAQDLVDFREKSILKDAVLAAYQQLAADAQSKPKFFAWFAINNKLLDQHTLEHDAYLTTWRGLGLRKVRSAEQYQAIVSVWSDTEVRCFVLFHKLFYGMLPDASDENYRFFAFCVCHLTEHPNIADLGKLYVDLIQKCTFQDFVKAVENNGVSPKHGDEPSLIKLFKANGFESEIQHFMHLNKALFSREFHQAVWYLKQYVISKDDDCRPDGYFGYQRAMATNDCAKLTAIYYDYLVENRADPMLLHQASVDDTVFECVKAVIPKLDPEYKKLMQNGSKRIEGVETEYCGCIDNYTTSETDIIHPMIPANHGLVTGA